MSDFRELSLTRFFIPTNNIFVVFSSIFLVCTFLVFGLPNLSNYYKTQQAPYAVPYVLPLLQTVLTVSVYATVAIAIYGAKDVRTETENENECFRWLKNDKLGGTGLTILAICLFSAVFNCSRWFEIETVVSISSESNQTMATLQV